MKAEQNKNLYGAGYYSDFFSEEECRVDIKNMREAGINLIRTGELFNGWDQIEREEGKFDFKNMDFFFDCCQEYGIQILLGTGTASPPQWLKKIDASIPIMDADGKQYPSDATYGWACPHNPTYEKYWKRYLKIIVLRYKDHPALYGYQIHNEIGFPFMSNENKVANYCFCEHTKRNFCIWLEKKYHSLEELNKSYWWSASNPYYSSFQDVQPPSSLPKSWSSVTRWLDFRRFLIDSIIEFVQKQKNWIDTWDGQHVVSLNTFFLKGEDPLGVMCAIDPFRLSSVVDIIGFDLYPGSSNKQEKWPEFPSLFLDLSRSASGRKDQAFWMLEVESGPINGWALGPHHNTDEQDIKRNACRCLGHNAKMQLYMGYREWLFQPINWGGLVDLNGEKTERYFMVKEINQKIRQYDLQSFSLKPLQANAAIVISKDNDILCQGFGHVPFMFDSLRAHYRIFWEAGMAVDFIPAENIERIFSYKIVTFPFLLTGSRRFFETIKEYVWQGGVIYGEPRFSFLDEKGWYQKERPVAIMQQVFGMKSIGIEKREHIVTSEKCIGYWHKETIEEKGCSTLDVYSDGEPAIIEHRWGKGKAIYGTSHFMLGYMYNDQSSFFEKFLKILYTKGIKNTIIVKYAKQEGHYVEAQVLEDTKRFVIFLESSLTKGKEECFSAEIILDRPCGVDSGKEVFTNKPIHFVEKENKIHFSWKMKKKESCIFELQKKKEENLQVQTE